eukprot:3756839-Amphidinium_carterae.2
MSLRLERSAHSPNASTALACFEANIWLATCSSFIVANCLQNVQHDQDPPIVQNHVSVFAIGSITRDEWSRNRLTDRNAKLDHWERTRMSVGNVTWTSCHERRGKHERLKLLAGMAPVTKNGT